METNYDYMARGSFGRTDGSLTYRVGFSDGRRSHWLVFGLLEWPTAWATYEALQERFGHHYAYLEAEYA